MYKSARFKAAATTRTRTPPICIVGKSCCSSCQSGPWPPMSARMVIVVSCEGWGDQLLSWGGVVLSSRGSGSPDIAAMPRSARTSFGHERGSLRFRPPRSCFEHRRAIEVNAFADQVLVGVEDEVRG